MNGCVVPLLCFCAPKVSLHLISPSIFVCICVLCCVVCCVCVCVRVCVVCRENIRKIHYFMLGVVFLQMFTVLFEAV